MRRSCLKLAIVVAIFSLPMVAQNSPVFSPPTPPPTRPAARPASAAPAPAPVAPVPPKTADASHTFYTGPKPPKAPVNAKGHHGKSKKVEVAAAPAPPPPPPPPPTPEQMQATPPQVSYLNGQLTIQSTNATLSSILNAIRQQTGASIDMPPGSGSERVATRVGPGPASDVIASLLNGSAFDFLILGNPNQPGGVQRIILTTKSGGSGMSGMLNRPAAAQQPEPDDSNNDDEAETPPEPPPPDQGQNQQPVPPVAGAVPPQLGQPVIPQPSAPGQPSAPDQSPVTGPTQRQYPPMTPPDQQGGNGPQVKTPEQMLQELQKLAPKQ